jgi:hypothetical protein
VNKLSKNVEDEKIQRDMLTEQRNRDLITLEQKIVALADQENNVKSSNHFCG